MCWRLAHELAKTSDEYRERFPALFAQLIHHIRRWWLLSWLFAFIFLSMIVPHVPMVHEYLIFFRIFFSSILSCSFSFARFSTEEKKIVEMSANDFRVRTTATKLQQFSSIVRLPVEDFSPIFFSRRWMRWNVLWKYIFDTAQKSRTKKKKCKIS